MKAKPTFETTLNLTTAFFMLGPQINLMSAKPTVTVSLAARVPTTVLLVGPADLSFHTFNFSLAAGPKGNIIGPVQTASQVLVAFGDGTPLQSFPMLFDSSVIAPSRDFAASLNEIWAASGGNLAVTLTSQTAGDMTMTLQGDWRRTVNALRVAGSQQPAQPELSLAVDPFHPIVVEIPIGSDWKKAKVSINVEVEVEPKGGLLTAMGSAVGGRHFPVQVTEVLHVAQGLRLRVVSTDQTLPSLHLIAAWLCLPAIPTGNQVVELRLSHATEEQLPDSQPIASWQAKLPADAGAYLINGADVWFRAPAPKPIAIDGTTVSELLFLVASGHGAGTPLCHKGLPALLPLDPPGRHLEGSAQVVNLAVDRSWAPQSFDQAEAIWRFELELAADDPAAPLVTAEVVTGVTLLPTPGGFTFNWNGPAGSPPPKLRLHTRSLGTMKLTVLAEGG
jgi:hypothetical protein